MGEYEINASKKMLFPYLNSASGLSQWFADDVTIDEDKVFHFIWDGESHKAKLSGQRMNIYVRFEFIKDEDFEPDTPYSIEFRLEQNEITDTVFLKVSDASDIEDEEELEELWESLIQSLKETVGG